MTPEEFAALPESTRLEMQAGRERLAEINSNIKAAMDNDAANQLAAGVAEGAALLVADAAAKEAADAAAKEAADAAAKEAADAAAIVTPQGNTGLDDIDALLKSKPKK